MLQDEEILKDLPVPAIGDVFSLKEYQGTAFKVSIGFEYPVDCSSPNDVSWFALSIQSPDGTLKKIIFDDETD
jgi:hypothetical protein